MAKYDVTLRTLTLGSQNAITGWYTRTYTPSTITMPIITKGLQSIGMGAGVEIRNDAVGFTTDAITIGDEAKDSASRYFEIIALNPQYDGGSLDFYMPDLHELPYHTDTRPAPAVAPTDIRYTIRTGLLAPAQYITNANITKDDGATPASWVSMFSGEDLPLRKIFLTKGVDGVFTIGEADTLSAELGIAFRGKYPIEAYAIDKTGITASLLTEKMMAEVRRVFKENPVGSMRGYDEEKSQQHVLGSTTVWTKKASIDYEKFRP